MKIKQIFILTIIMLNFTSLIFSKDDETWELVWSDEFDSQTLDAIKWSYWENDNPWKQGNFVDETGKLIDQYGFNAKQYYLNENVTFTNGNAVITAKQEDNKFVSVDGVQRKILFSSGAFHTKDTYTVKYGKIEVRATMPKGIGTWPAIWMWPENYSIKDNKPASGEIDITEVYGDNFRKVTGTAHALKADNTYKSFFGSNLKIRKDENLEGYNTYAIEWSEKEIVWLFNGRKYKKVKTKNILKYAKNPFDQPYYIMINLALQEKTGNDPATLKDFPTEMKIDYVRVYQKINPLKYFD